MERPKTTKNVGQPCVICGQSADAQATIAALQARVRTATQLIIAEIGASGPEDLEEAIGRIVARLTQRTAERDTARRRVDELEAREVDVVLLRDDLEQRTAELEAIEKTLDIDSGKTTVEKVRDLHHSFKQVWESYQDASKEMFKAQAELERVRAVSNPCSKIFTHKWLDPECVENGCQSLKLKHRQGMEG